MGIFPALIATDIFSPKLDSRITRTMNTSERRKTPIKTFQMKFQICKQLETDTLPVSIADQHAKPTESVNLEAKESVTFTIQISYYFELLMFEVIYVH